MILDLEDGVAAESRPLARRHVATWVSEPRAAWVRINAAGTNDWEQDLIGLTESGSPGLSGVVLAKVNDPEDVADTVGRLRVPVVALIETALGVEQALRIARAPGVVALAFGVADLQLELGLASGADGWAYARSRLVFASRAAGLRAPIDGPTLRIDDPDEAARDARRARESGFGDNCAFTPIRSTLSMSASVIRPKRSCGRVEWSMQRTGLAEARSESATR